MLLSAMLLAVAVQAAPVGPPPEALRPPTSVTRWKGRVGCAATNPTLTRGGLEGRARPLDQEPRAGLNYAVLRLVDGCPVASPMR